MAWDGKERRREPRARISQTIRIRIANGTEETETYATVNVSRAGLYFITNATHYFPGMEVRVIRNFDPADQLKIEETGQVIRIENLKNGKTGVAVQIGPVRFETPF